MILKTNFSRSFYVVFLELRCLFMLCFMGLKSSLATNINDKISQNKGDIMRSSFFGRAFFLASFFGLFGGVAFGADFSNKSDNELINLAGNVAPSDEPDFVIEVKKRINAKPYQEAKAFKHAIKQSRHRAFSKLTSEQAQKRAIESCKAMQARTDSMTGAQIRASGLKVIYKDCSQMGEKAERKHHKGKFKGFDFDD